MKLIVRVIGILAVLMGIVWMAQGSGLFPYPATSPMISQTIWIWYGAALFLAGVVAVAISRRIGR